MSAADLRALAEVDAAQPLPSDKVQTVLTSPPFVYVPGTFNTRDLGLVPTPTGAPSKLRSGFVYRSGGLDRLTADGKSLLAEKLGIKKIFDLRSVEEHGQSPDPEIAGVETVWAGSDEPAAKVQIDDFIEGEGEKGYEKMYLDVLHLYRSNFRAVLEHIRDHPTQPFLFHCTAGRDRTGVLSGLLLTLAGADPDTVSLDYLLSRIGTEPAREQLLAFAMKGSRITSVDAPGFSNLVNLRTVGWNAFLGGLDRDYGGFSGYVTKTLGFSEDDLNVIVKNLSASA